MKHEQLVGSLARHQHLRLVNAFEEPYVPVFGNFSMVCLAANDLAVNSAVNAQKKLDKRLKLWLRNKLIIDSDAVEWRGRLSCS
jgi:hypothetical protein